jgi:hypothetical protein
VFVSGVHYEKRVEIIGVSDDSPTAVRALRTAVVR